MGDDVSVFALLTHSCKQVYNKGMWSRLKQDRQGRKWGRKPVRRTGAIAVVEGGRRAGGSRIDAAGLTAVKASGETGVIICNMFCLCTLEKRVRYGGCGAWDPVSGVLPFLPVGRVVGLDWIVLDWIAGLM